MLLADDEEKSLGVTVPVRVAAALALREAESVDDRVAPPAASPAGLPVAPVVGVAAGVNDAFVKLEDAEVVYVTGPFNTKAWETAEKFPKDWYIQTSAIESFGLLK